MTRIPSFCRPRRAALGFAALAILAAAPFFAPALHAQAGDPLEAVANLNATVYVPLAVSVGQPMEFGQIYPMMLGGTATFQTHSASLASASPGAQPAYFNVSGHGGAEVEAEVRWTNLTLMDPMDFSVTIPLVDMKAQWRSAPLGSGTDLGALHTITASGDTHTHTLSGSSATTATDVLYIEASITPVDGQTAGWYAGDILVSINYTGS